MKRGQIQTIMSPSYLGGQHTQAHASLMPHWGTIWWKNAKRLLECDPVLEAPTCFDIFWCLLITHVQQIQIYYLFGSLSGQLWTTGHTGLFSCQCAKEKQSPVAVNIFYPQKDILLFFESLHTVGWQIGTLDLQYTKQQTGSWKSLSL